MIAIMTSGLQQTTIRHVGNGMQFEWDLNEDRASLARIDSAGHGQDSTQNDFLGKSRTFWTGSLLPAFEIDGQPYVKAAATSLSFGPEGEWRITLDWGEYGAGLLICEAQPWGFRMTKLEASW